MEGKGEKGENMNIVGVVVTYNRKELLVECLSAILNQTIKPSKVIVIDNNSNDGTYEKLKEEKIIENETIVYQKLEENIGGAGGFYEGMKRSLEYNPDWVWVMDDDTVPTLDCLEQLINAHIETYNPSEKVSFYASCIYGMNNESMNVPDVDVSATQNGYADWYTKLSKGMIKIAAATFVSLLINGDAIRTCGLPCRDFFIWGDDTEYTTRITRNYGPAYMVGKSVAIHKRKNAKSLSIYNEDNKARLKMHYYKTRNNLLVTSAYKSKKSLIKAIILNYINIIKILIKPNCKYRFAKAGALLKGTNAFIFRRYDYKAFKNREKIGGQF